MRGTTRRRHAANQLLMLQNPHRSQPRAPRRLQDLGRADWRDNVATLKPTTPLLAPNKGLLKPVSPLRPKNTLKTPISHPQRRWRFQSRLGRCPQRRWRFQSRLGRCPQRRWRFQSHAGASEERRQGFQTTRPPRLQHPNASPVGGGAWPRHPWAATTPPPAKFRT